MSSPTPTKAQSLHRHLDALYRAVDVAEEEYRKCIAKSILLPGDLPVENPMLRVYTELSLTIKAARAYIQDHNEEMKIASALLQKAGGKHGNVH